MSSNTSQVTCPGPFLPEVHFSNHGFLDGRFCSKLLGPSCCLPCPQTDWVYPDNFHAITTAANWTNVVSLLCIAFLLASFAALPVGMTHRHYLSICLLVGVSFMSLGFIIPLGAKPEQCYDAITPNSMSTSPSCAISGAFLLAGGWAAVMWVFLRALALHLQICWQVVIGKAFMWGALAAGWCIPAIGLSLAVVFSGFSFRFGDTCHINHQNSLSVLWIPLLVFAGITVITQSATFGYCIKVYLASLSDEATTTGTSDLPTYSDSVRGTISPRQAYRRVRRVIELQWRGIAIVLLIVADVIYFALVFVFMDNTEENMIKDPAKSQEWLACLVVAKGDKNVCLDKAEHFAVSEATVMSVILLLSLNGVWCFCFLGRLSMFKGWYDLCFNKPDPEFISADVRQKKDPGNYEMLSHDRAAPMTPMETKPTQPLISAAATPSILSPLSPVAMAHAKEEPDYFGREARYKSPSRSFSSPKPPGNFQTTSWGSASTGASGKEVMEWDSTTSHAQPSLQGRLDPLGMNKI